MKRASQMRRQTFFGPCLSPDTPCPICQVPCPHSPEHPTGLCASCVDRAVDEGGLALLFFNVNASGGIKTVYADTREERSSHICFVDGVRCRADEARFGGIVVEPYPEQAR